MPYRGRCVNLVIATKKWDDVLPCIARCVEAVQEHDGRTVRRHGAKSYTSPQIDASEVVPVFVENSGGGPSPEACLVWSSGERPSTPRRRSKGPP